MRRLSWLISPRVRTLGGLSASLATFLCVATAALPNSGSGASAATAFDRAFDLPPATNGLSSPLPFQVFPRDGNDLGKADIPVRPRQGNTPVVDAGISKAEEKSGDTPKDGTPKVGAGFVGDRLLDVPTGGPYTITSKLKSADQPLLPPPATPVDGPKTNNVLVGDLWIIAGGSNMVGHGRLADAAPPNPKVSILTLDNEWRNAEEPLLGPHVELAPDPIDIGTALDTKKNPRNKVVIAKVADKPDALMVFDVDPDGKTRGKPPRGGLLNPVPASLASLLEKQWTSSIPIEAAVERGVNNILNVVLPATNPSPPPATGLGLTFASAIVEKTAVPIGLVAYAYDDAELNYLTVSTARFDDLTRRLRINGALQKVKGVIWFQGEADAEFSSTATAKYQDDLKALIKNLRSTMKAPRLPFLVVQLGRRAGKSTLDLWNAVREAQRRVSDELVDVYVVASIDLGIEGNSYIDAPGLKRLGARLAKVAARDVYNVAGATGPNFESYKVTDATTILVQLRGVNPTPQPATADTQKPADKTTPPDKAASTNETKITLTVTTPAPTTTTSKTTTDDSTKKTDDSTKKADDSTKKTDDSTQKKTAATQVASRLVPGRQVPGFSIRDDNGTDWEIVTSATVEKSGDAILLKLSDKLDGKYKYHLWYGYGHNPTCDLVDGQDMAVPTFGPIEIKP